jgi:hypothetical protein
LGGGITVGKTANNIPFFFSSSSLTYIQEKILLLTRIVVPLSTNKPAQSFSAQLFEYKKITFLYNLINTFQGVGAEYVQYLLCIARCFPDISSDF